MNTCVLQILERKDGLHVEGLSGMYIKDYDPCIDHDLNYTLTVVDTPAEAKVFFDPAEAMAFYRSVSPNYSTLIDGTINRPLTSWSVIVVPFDTKG